jgi:hypothetical protein
MHACMPRGGPMNANTVESLGPTQQSHQLVCSCALVLTIYIPAVLQMPYIYRQEVTFGSAKFCDNF